MNDQIKIIECPRDAWQGLPVHIAAEVKANYLGKLIKAGFTHLDAVSFVSPTAVPQMADSERVLELLNPPDHVEIIGIVVNTKGAERAIRTGAVRTLAFPYSCSPQFLQRNQRQTQKEAMETLRTIEALARPAGVGVVTHLSMAFGNPYGDPWSIADVIGACDEMIDAGVRHISLADTVGLASPERIAETMAPVLAAHPDFEIGAHLHARRGAAALRIRAAYDAGCRLFDAAMGGLGGCPFAQDGLVGNIATEELIETMTKAGARPPVIESLDELTRTNAVIAANYGTSCEKS